MINTTYAVKQSSNISTMEKLVENIINKYLLSLAKQLPFVIYYNFKEHKLHIYIHSFSLTCPSLKVKPIFSVETHDHLSY